MQSVIGSAWALSVYREGTRELIRKLKYRKQRSVLPYIKTLLARAEGYKGIQGLLEQSDLAIPVPLHEERERQRGFNQAELIFAVWLQEHGVPMVRALERVRPTKPMYQLQAEERQENLRGAFAADAAVIAGKRILLVDDIMTTGATIAACVRELERAEAARICVLVLASDHRG